MPPSEDLMIDLFALPVSYWAVPGLDIGFTLQGWPAVLTPTPADN